MGDFVTTAENEKSGISSGDGGSGSVPYVKEEAGGGEGNVRYNSDALKRHLGNRQIQMIAIGGSIGTALFVSIGSGLMDGGPGSLFIAYTLYSALLGLVNSSMAEMAVFMPISGAETLLLSSRHCLALTST